MKITGLLIHLYRREIILAFHQQYLIQRQDNMGFPGGSVVKSPPPMQETQVQSLISEPRNHNYWAHLPQQLKLMHPTAHALQ